MCPKLREDAGEVTFCGSEGRRENRSAHSEVGGRFDRIEGRLGRIEDELLVLNGIALRLEGREVETTGLKAILDRHERGLAAPPH